MFKVKLVKIKDNDNRAVLITEARGLPVDIPCRYLLGALNQESFKSVNNKANSICQLLRWEAERNIDLLNRFRSGHLLNMTERDSLVRYLSLNQKYSGRNENVIHFGGYVGAEMLNLKINHTKAYLGFLCELALETKKITDPLYVALDAGLKRLNEELDTKKVAPLKKKRVGLTFEEQGLLLKVTHPEHENNPFKGYTRERNYLAFCLLLLSGVRISELLSLRIEKCMLTGDEPYIEISQNTEIDPRLEKPEVKTVGRKIYITKLLADQIDKYINGGRKLRGRLARKCPSYLFLNAAKNPAPWTYSSFSSALVEVRKHFPALKGLTSHRLRHSFNDNFDLLFEGELSDKERDKFKKYICGWTDDSQQTDNYNRRATEIRSRRYLMELQETVLSGDSKRQKYEEFPDIPF